MTDEINTEFRKLAGLLKENRKNVIIIAAYDDDDAVALKCFATKFSEDELVTTYSAILSNSLCHIMRWAKGDTSKIRRITGRINAELQETINEIFSEGRN